MTEQQPEAPADELASLKRTARTLANIVARNHQVMEAARIEMRQNGPHAAMQWVLNSLGDVWDDPETEWDGKESAEEWFDRTESFYRAAKEAASDEKAPAVPSPPVAAVFDRAEGPWTESPGVALIAVERSRQVAAEGYTPEHDAEHGRGELALAATAYALAASGRCGHALVWWPFGGGFKPGIDPIASLVKAGALIAAELDRLLAKGAHRG